MNFHGFFIEEARAFIYSDEERGMGVLTQAQQEGLVGDVLRASYEAVTLEDLGTQVLPLLNRAFDTSTSVIYQCDERGAVPMYGGFCEFSSIYFENYVAQDPLQTSVRRLQPLMMRASQLPEWERYLKHPTYTELCHPHDLDYYVHLRLFGDAYFTPGMVGLLLSRSIRQPDFSERDVLILARILPALEALVRRSTRLLELFGMNQLIGNVLQLDPRPKIALDCRGALLWVSDRAETLLGLSHGEKKTMHERLAQAAQRLGLLAGKNSDLPLLPTSVSIPRKDGAAIRADLRLARTRNGAYFILVELEDAGDPSFLKELIAHYRLTASETQVLHLISLGLSDREIGQRLFVSKATVHSHVTRILGKLGVRSRVQAALVAHGIKPEVDLNDE